MTTKQPIKKLSPRRLGELAHARRVAVFRRNRLHGPLQPVHHEWLAEVKAREDAARIASYREGRTKPVVLPEGMRWCRCHWGKRSGQLLPAELFGTQTDNNICKACDRKTQQARRDKLAGVIPPFRSELRFNDNQYHACDSLFRAMQFGPPTAAGAARIAEECQKGLDWLKVQEAQENRRPLHRRRNMNTILIRWTTERGILES